MKVLRVDWERCQGHGKCYLIAPDLFEPDEIDEWGRAVLINPDVDDRDRAQLQRAEMTVGLCPEHAISLVPGAQRPTTGDGG